MAAVSIAGFVVPSVGVFLVSVYVHTFFNYHRDGYPGLPLHAIDLAKDFFHLAAMDRLGRELQRKAMTQQLLRGSSEDK
jgi:hypothetical protein